MNKTMEEHDRNRSDLVNESSQIEQDFIIHLI